MYIYVFAKETCFVRYRYRMRMHKWHIPLFVPFMLAYRAFCSNSNLLRLVDICQPSVVACFLSLPGHMLCTLYFVLPLRSIRFFRCVCKLRFSIKILPNYVNFFQLYILNWTCGGTVVISEGAELVIVFWAGSLLYCHQSKSK